MLAGLAEVGLTPSCEFDGGQIVVKVSTARVEAVGVFTRRGSRPWHMTGRSLSVDGQRMPVVTRHVELRQVVDDPDWFVARVGLIGEQAYERLRPGRMPEPGLPVAGDAQVPRTVAEAFAPWAAHPDAQATLLRTASGGWQVRLGKPDSDAYVVLVFYGHPQPMKARVLLVEPGRGVWNCGASLEVAAGLLGVEVPQQAGVGGGVGLVSGVRSAPRTKNDAVAVKQNTVIRT